MQLQAIDDSGAVELRGADGDVQATGNSFRRATLRDKAQHFDLALGERAFGGQRLFLFALQTGTHVLAAVQNRPNSGKQFFHGSALRQIGLSADIHGNVKKRASVCI